MIKIWILILHFIKDLTTVHAMVICNYFLFNPVTILVILLQTRKGLCILWKLCKLLNPWNFIFKIFGDSISNFVGQSHWLPCDGMLSDILYGTEWEYIIYLYLNHIDRIPTNKVPVYLSIFKCKSNWNWSSHVLYNGFLHRSTFVNIYMLCNLFNN